MPVPARTRRHCPRASICTPTTCTDPFEPPWYSLSLSLSLRLALYLPPHYETTQADALRSMQRTLYPFRDPAPTDLTTLVAFDIVEHVILVLYRTIVIRLGEDRASGDWLHAPHSPYPTLPSAPFSCSQIYIQVRRNLGLDTMAVSSTAHRISWTIGGQKKPARNEVHQLDQRIAHFVLHVRHVPRPNHHVVEYSS